jgi:hypothetical protein
VVWDLRVEPLDDRTCEYANHLATTATDELLAAMDAHNEQETPRFAASIERRALAAGHTT